LEVIDMAETTNPAPASEELEAGPSLSRARNILRPAPVRFDRIQARQLEIVDDAGHVRIRLEIDENGYARVLMFTADGKRAAREHVVVHLCAYPDRRDGFVKVEGRLDQEFDAGA
jgi:hypothetical protein